MNLPFRLPSLAYSSRTELLIMLQSMWFGHRSFNFLVQWWICQRKVNPSSGCGSQMWIFFRQYVGFQPQMMTTLLMENLVMAGKLATRLKSILSKMHMPRSQGENFQKLQDHGNLDLYLFIPYFICVSAGTSGFHVKMMYMIHLVAIR